MSAQYPDISAVKQFRLHFNDNPLGYIPCYSWDELCLFADLLGVGDFCMVVIDGIAHAASPELLPRLGY